MKIKVTSVYVDDQNKALRFYTEVLGFVKKTDFSKGPYRWLTVESAEEPDGTVLHLARNKNTKRIFHKNPLFLYCSYIKQFHMRWFFCAPVAADAHQRGLKDVLGTTFLADAGTTSTLSRAVSAWARLRNSSARFFNRRSGQPFRFPHHKRASGRKTIFYAGVDQRD